MAAGRMQVIYAFVSTNALSGTSIPGQDSFNILLLQSCIMVDIPTNLQFFSSTGMVPVSPIFPFGAHSSLVLPYSAVGWGKSQTPGDSIVFTQTGGANLAIYHVYCYF